MIILNSKRKNASRQHNLLHKKISQDSLRERKADIKYEETAEVEK